MEDDLKILQVEYLSNHYSDLISYPKDLCDLNTLVTSPIFLSSSNFKFLLNFILKQFWELRFLISTLMMYLLQRYVDTCILITEFVCKADFLVKIFLLLYSKISFPFNLKLLWKLKFVNS